MISAQSARAQWTRIEAPGMDGVFLYSVDFETPLLGHAIGSARGTTSIYRTTDGGSAWEALKDLGLNPFGFIFLDENIGLAGGRSPGCGCTAISRTTDGGRTWKLDSIRSADGTTGRVPASFGINSFSFLDNTTGYAVGPYGAIVKTTDRGATWARLNTGSTTDFMADVSFSGEERGYAIAAALDNLYSPNIFYRTTDGGNNWQKIPGFIMNSGFGEIRFITPETGFVGGNDGMATIYKTTDGGENWVRKYGDGGNGDAIYGIEFQDLNVGYAIGSGGTILRTADGGESWIKETTGTKEVLQGISITDGVIYVAGADGTVLRRDAAASGIGREYSAGAEVSLLPNPFTSSATIAHPELASHGGALIIYDLLGRELKQTTAEPGNESLVISRNGLPPGSYIYRLLAGSRILASGMVIVE